MYSEHELSLICSVMKAGVEEMMVTHVPNPFNLIQRGKKQVLKLTSKTHMAFVLLKSEIMFSR